MVAPGPWTCRLAKAPLRHTPARDGEQVSEILFGEVCEVSDRAGDWVRVCLVRDNYCGWTPDTALSRPSVGVPTTTVYSTEYRIGQPAALVFTRPDIKSPLLHRLYLGSPLAISSAEGDFYELDSGGFVHRRHLTAQTELGTGPVDVALGFIGTPYLWGGRTCDGIDCSGLVQTALHACGFDCPRDTGDQRAAFAADAVSGPLQRGDLVYFPGHVGIMVDAAHLLHANAFWMSTVVEPLIAVTSRLQQDVCDPIVAVIRPV